MGDADVDKLLLQLEERASTARTIFQLLDSDSDGLVAVEQVSLRQKGLQPSMYAWEHLDWWTRPLRRLDSAFEALSAKTPTQQGPVLIGAPPLPLGPSQLSSMLTSMLLSQSLNYDGDVEEFVLQITRHRHLVGLDRHPDHPACV